MAVIITVLVLSLIIGLSYYFDPERNEEKKREEFKKNVEETNKSFVNSKSFKDQLIKEEISEESKGIGSLTEHIKSVVIDHPESVKKLTENDKKALGKINKNSKRAPREKK